MLAYSSLTNFQTVSRQEVGHRATVAQVGLVAGRNFFFFFEFSPRRDRTFYNPRSNRRDRLILPQRVR